MSPYLFVLKVVVHGAMGLYFRPKKLILKEEFIINNAYHVNNAKDPLIFRYLLWAQIMIFIVIFVAIKYLGLVNMLELLILLSFLETMESLITVQDVVAKSVF